MQKATKQRREVHDPQKAVCAPPEKIPAQAELLVGLSSLGLSIEEICRRGETREICALYIRLLLASRIVRFLDMALEQLRQCVHELGIEAEPTMDSTVEQHRSLAGRFYAAQLGSLCWLSECESIKDLNGFTSRCLSFPERFHKEVLTPLISGYGNAADALVKSQTAARRLAKELGSQRNAILKWRQSTEQAVFSRHDALIQYTK